MYQKGKVVKTVLREKNVNARKWQFGVYGISRKENEYEQEHDGE